MTLSDLKDKKILILGFGREGRDSFKFLRKLFPQKSFGVADQKEIKNLKLKIKNFKNVKWHCGENYLRAIKNYDLIIKSPGISAEIIAPFITKKQKITSQTEIFLENCPGKIIGVAGTKGKGTTALLIYQILQQAGFKAHLIGNIGKPVLQFLFSATPKTIYVYEISSHQLYNLKMSPSIAILLNIHPDHLDHFKNLKEYIKAEGNIVPYQKKNDYLIFNSQDKLVKKIAQNSQAKKIPIQGKDYELNKQAARVVGKLFKIPIKKIESTIKNSKTLPHRLEFVGTYQGIKFYNDSSATIPEATIFGLNVLGYKVQTILLGGSDKKTDFKMLARRILKSKIKNIIFFPTTGKKIWQEIIKEAVGKKTPQHFFVDNMKLAVELAYQNTQKGKICLLSPACASFSIFRDYKDRGELFKKYVKKLARKSY